MKTMKEVCQIENALFVVPAADNGWIPSVCSEGIAKTFKEDLKTNPDGVVMGIELEHGRMLFLARCKEKGRGGGGINEDRWKDCLTRIQTTQRGMLYVPAIISKKQTIDNLNEYLDDEKETIDGFEIVNGTLGKEILFELEDENDDDELSDDGSFVPHPEAVGGGVSLQQEELDPGTVAKADIHATTTDSEQQEEPVVESPSPLLDGEIKPVSDKPKPHPSIYDSRQKTTHHLCLNCGHPKKWHEKEDVYCEDADCECGATFKDYPEWTCQTCGEMCYCSYDYQSHKLDCFKPKKKATVSVNGQKIATTDKDITIDIVDDIDERFKLAGETVERMKKTLEKQIIDNFSSIKKLGRIVDELRNSDTDTNQHLLNKDDPHGAYGRSMASIKKELRSICIIATENEHDTLAIEALEVITTGLDKLEELVTTHWAEK